MPGRLGKMFSGPWMKRFYTSAESQVDDVDGIGVVKEVIAELKLYHEDPASILSRNRDLFL